MSREELDAALKILSEAHGPAALADAMHSVQASVKRSRKAEAKTMGPLATIITSALAERDEMRRQGCSEADLAKGFEQVVRDAWPKPHNRTEPWRYNCEQCSDTGLVMHQCVGDAICGRTFPHGPHDYGEPCWCSKGNRHREKSEHTPDDDTTNAARQKKPSRWGR